MRHFDTHLPVIQTDDESDQLPSCSPTIYVSNEEVALFAAMRELRGRSAEIKRELKAAAEDARPALEAELESRRAEWQELARRREQAFVRKMIMLGHLPPDHPVDR